MWHFLHMFILYWYLTARQGSPTDERQYFYILKKVKYQLWLEGNLTRARLPWPLLDNWLFCIDCLKIKTSIVEFCGFFFDTSCLLWDFEWPNECECPDDIYEIKTNRFEVTNYLKYDLCRKLLLFSLKINSVCRKNDCLSVHSELSLTSSSI